MTDLQKFKNKMVSRNSIGLIILIACILPLIYWIVYQTDRAQKSGQSLQTTKEASQKYLTENHNCMIDVCGIDSSRFIIKEKGKDYILYVYVEGFDSCEYILYKAPASEFAHNYPSWGSHKGTCRYCQLRKNEYTIK